MKKKDENQMIALEEIDDAFSAGDEILDTLEGSEKIHDSTDMNSSRDRLEQVENIVQSTGFIVSNLKDFSSEFKEVIYTLTEYNRTITEFKGKIAVLLKTMDIEMEREKTRSEVILQCLEIIKNSTSLMLQKALSIDYSLCSDREFEMAQQIIKNATEQNNRAIGLISRYFGG